MKECCVREKWMMFVLKSLLSIATFINRVSDFLSCPNYFAIDLPSSYALSLIKFLHNNTFLYFFNYIYICMWVNKTLIYILHVHIFLITHTNTIWSNFFQKFVWTLRPIEERALKYFLYVILCSKDLYKLLPFNRVFLETMNMNVK